MYHRPALCNFIGKILLRWKYFVAPFVDTPMLLLLLKVSLVWLSREESIRSILEEMTLISLKHKNKIHLLLVADSNIHTR